jgi:hypothetical protein
MHAYQLDSYEILEYEIDNETFTGYTMVNWRIRIRKKVCEREKGSIGHRKKRSDYWIDQGLSRWTK